MSENDYVPSLVAPSRRPETVKITSDDTDGGFVIINASDFDAATMTLFGAEPKGKLPAVAELAAHLATLDVEAVQALQAKDDRKSAAPLYDARLAELAK